MGFRLQRLFPLIRILILLVALVPFFPDPVASSSFSARVSKVIDGDSLRVRASGAGEMELRLYGLDAPEYDQPYAARAREFLRRRLHGQRVLVEAVETDQYGRTVALVSRDGGLVNEELVAAGLAWVSPRYCRRPFCAQWQRLEERARRQGSGLWRQAEPIAPWRWKRMARRR